MSENVAATENFDPAEHVRAMIGRHYRTADYYEVGRRTSTRCTGTATRPKPSAIAM